MAADPETIPGSPIADQSRSPASVPASAAGAKMAMVRAVPYEAFHGSASAVIEPVSRSSDQVRAAFGKTPRLLMVIYEMSVHPRD